MLLLRVGVRCAGVWAAMRYAPDQPRSGRAPGARGCAHCVASEVCALRTTRKAVRRARSTLTLHLTLGLGAQTRLALLRTMVLHLRMRRRCPVRLPAARVCIPRSRARCALRKQGPQRCFTLAAHSAALRGSPAPRCASPYFTHGMARAAAGALRRSARSRSGCIPHRSWRGDGCFYDTS